MSAASITDNPGNTLLDDGKVIARGGQGLSLAYLTAYPNPDADDKLAMCPARSTRRGACRPTPRTPTMPATAAS